MKRLLAVILCFLSVFCFLSGTAMAANSAKIYGNIGSSKVEISVQIDGSDEKLKPNDVSRQIVTIKNNGANCYIRVSPKFNTQVELEGVRPEWILKNDVYYYKTPLATGDSIQFCQGIKVPENVSEKDIKADFFVDAIQSANMILDFNAEEPWGKVAVTKAIDRKTEVLKSLKSTNKGIGSDSLELHYNEDAQALISNFDEIFTNMPLLHPGDSYTETIKLYNPTKTAKTLYMSDENDNAEILKYITVGIKSVVDDKTTDIYSGPISGNGEKSKIDVGTLEPGSKGELIITAKMDSGVGNEASALSGHVELTMEASDKGTTIRNEEEKTETEIKTRSPKTGEDKNSYKILMSIAVILAMGALMLLHSLKREWDD